MAVWTTPKTWNVGDILTAADMNTYVRDNTAFLHDPICDLTLGGSQASFDTNTILGGNIPQTYSHLRLVLQLREDDAVAATNAALRFNADAGANYNGSYIQGSNNAATAAESLGATSFSTVVMSIGANGSAGKFSMTDLLIPDYAHTTAQKGLTGISNGDSLDTAAGFNTRSVAGTWKSTAAITRIQVLPGSGNFVAGSRLTLYGLP